MVNHSYGLLLIQLDEKAFEGPTPLAWAWEYLIAANLRPKWEKKLQSAKSSAGIIIIQAESRPHDSPTTPAFVGANRWFYRKCDDEPMRLVRLRNSISGSERRELVDCGVWTEIHNSMKTRKTDVPVPDSWSKNWNRNFAHLHVFSSSPSLSYWRSTQIDYSELLQGHCAKKMSQHDIINKCLKF